MCQLGAMLLCGRLSDMSEPQNQADPDSAGAGQLVLAP